MTAPKSHEMLLPFWWNRAHLCRTEESTVSISQCDCHTPKTLNNNAHVVYTYSSQGRKNDYWIEQITKILDNSTAENDILETLTHER